MVPGGQLREAPQPWSIASPPDPPPRQTAAAAVVPDLPPGEAPPRRLSPPKTVPHHDTTARRTPLPAVDPSACLSSSLHIHPLPSFTQVHLHPCKAAALVSLPPPSYTQHQIGALLSGGQGSRCPSGFLPHRTQQQAGTPTPVPAPAPAPWPSPSSYSFSFPACNTTSSFSPSLFPCAQQLSLPFCLLSVSGSRPPSNSTARPPALQQDQNNPKPLLQ
ncbi:hypothetical protein BS78_10G149000 [Paspalum vaginatum]|nr:hypothetical protein BS78_10G149000 [Paspalum vaginatum]